jgi:hypothetical protein
MVFEWLPPGRINGFWVLISLVSVANFTKIIELHFYQLETHPTNADINIFTQKNLL